MRQNSDGDGMVQSLRKKDKDGKKKITKKKRFHVYKEARGGIKGISLVWILFLF